MWKTSHARRHRLNASEYIYSPRPRTRTRTRARTPRPHPHQYFMFQFALQLLALASPTTAPRKIKMGLEKNPRGPFVLLHCCTPRDRILSTQTFFGTPLHLILSTQTFSSNSLAPDSYYTNFFLQPLCT